MRSQYYRKPKDTRGTYECCSRRFRGKVAFFSFRFVLFLSSFGTGWGLLQSAEHYHNKIQTSKQCSQLGWLLLAFDKLGK